jgi:polar amino acid transport system permease protein
VTEHVSDTDWQSQSRAIAGLPIGRRVHPGRMVIATLALLMVVFVLQGLVRNNNFQWHVVRYYFFAPSVLDGIRTTISLTVISMAIALVVAVALANMRLAHNAVLRSLAGVYVWFFRSVPLLVLLILGFNFSVIYPTLGLGIPFGHQLFSVSLAHLLTAYWTAALAFGLQQAAYTSETIRASILAVPTGQREAAQALGMTPARSFFRIIFPQAMKIAIPPIGNDTINLLKGTSLVAFIAVPDLLYSVQTIYNRTYQVVPLLMVACLWYMIFVSILSAGQYYLEKKLSRGRQTTGRPDRPRRGWQWWPHR